jgi:hypothetical protein
LIGKRYTHIFGLSTIDSTSQRPTTIWVGTIVYKTILAEETLSAKGLYIDGYSITRLYTSDLLSHFFHHTYHFVAYGNTRNGTRHASVLDM